MTEVKLRILLRWMHIVLGLVVMFYIYSPFHRNEIFQLVMKWGVIPGMTLTGIWIWKFKSINKMIKIK